MNEKNVQIIEKDGRPEYAVLSFEDYRRMIDLLDDNSDCAAIDHALREDEAGDTIPDKIVNAILDGVKPLRAWRQHREFTLDMLADRIGVSKEYLSQIENGQKSGTVDIFRRLSNVLDVALDDLVDMNRDTTSFLLARNTRFK